MPGWHQLSLTLKMAGPFFLLLVQMNPVCPLLSPWPLSTQPRLSLGSGTSFFPLSLLFPFDCGLGKSLARTGSRPSPNPAEWDWVTVSMDYACSLCVAGSVCVHTCTRVCEHSLRWCTSAFSGLPAAQTKDQVSDGTRLLALTPLDSSLKFSLHQVWVLMGCRPCPWTITLSGRSIYGAPAKRFH